jgi:hypothetical protein
LLTQSSLPAKSNDRTDRFARTDRSNTVKSVIARLSLVAASALVATTAFAGGGGIGHAGTYEPTFASTDAGPTRAEVRAGIVQAYNNGTLPALNRNTYPERSMAGDAIAAQHDQRAHDAAVAEQRNRSIVEYANGSATQSGKAKIQ